MLRVGAELQVLPCARLYIVQGMAKRSGSLHFTVLFLSTVLWAGAGCGGDDDDTNVDGGGGGGSDAGAGGDDGSDDDDGAGACTDEPCLDPPAEGFQVRSVGGEIEPGTDVEYCEVVQLPGTADDTYYVKGFESVMTRGSHHLIVSAVIPGSDTDKNTKVGDRVECITGSVWGDDLTDVTGQQLPEHAEAYPAGVGKVFLGGQKVIFDYHYFNATDNPLQARAAVNFLTTASENIEHEAQGFGKLNLAIFAPPMQTSDFPDSCRMNQDVMVHKLTRHTHQWGTDFPVSLNRADGSEPELIYTSPNYEDPDHIFEEPILVREGEGFDFICNYNNDTERTLTFGVKATDEMCILFGSMYSPTERVLPPGTACE
jgi:hypothetical protein